MRKERPFLAGMLTIAFFTRTRKLRTPAVHLFPLFREPLDGLFSPDLARASSPWFSRFFALRLRLHFAMLLFIINREGFALGV